MTQHHDERPGGPHTGPSPHVVPGPATPAEPTADPHPDAGPASLGRDTADLPPRSRGVIALLEENCTVCMLCARECPDWCIYIESHQEPVPGHEHGGGPDPAHVPQGRGRQRVRNVLDRFAI